MLNSGCLPPPTCKIGYLRYERFTSILQSLEVSENVWGALEYLGDSWGDVQGSPFSVLRNVRGSSDQPQGLTFTLVGSASLGPFCLPDPYLLCPQPLR